jgi:hypothetical protein
MWQLIGGAVGAIGGAVIAGPAGATIGASLGASLGGMVTANDANKKANSAIQAGVQQVQATDSNIANQASADAASGGTGPGASYLRDMIADPGTLTPAQQSQLADLRLSTANQLHGSDFAGNGRTAAAIFQKTEDSFTNTALDQNRQRAVGAATTLTGASTAARGQEFNAMQAGANAGLQGAETTAANDIATGKIMGQALGDVGSAAAKASKLSTLGPGSPSVSPSDAGSAVDLAAGL